MPLRPPAIPSLAHRSRFLIGAFLLLALPARAETLVCHVTYGGETRILEKQPVTSPYRVPVQAIGSYFLFRMLFEKEAPNLAAIKLYVFANHDTGPAPIHQATHPYPPPPAGARYGFTGLHRVYEPIRDGELEYWCELSSPAGGAA